MTYIIKNIYSRLFNQSLFSRSLGAVLLTFALLIGGTGSAWAVIATDFEIDLTKNPVGDLPTGVTQISYPNYGASYNGTQHGWCWYAIEFEVDCAVDITLGCCQYTNAGYEAYLVGEDGDMIATIDNKTPGCDGTVTYKYRGEGQKLKLYCGQYCPSIKVSKAVFATDFEIDLTKDFVLPSGVAKIVDSRGGAYNHGDSHGWCWYAIEFEVDGPVDVTIGGCDYQNNYYGYVTDGSGKKLADIKNNKCSDTFTYSYRRKGTVMRLYCGQYCPSIKVAKSDAPVEPDGIIIPDGIYNVAVSTARELKNALETGGSSSARKTIFLRNGTYDLGTLYGTEVKDYTTLVGQSRDGVIIMNAPETEGLLTSATLKTGSNVILQNLTLKCTVKKVDGAERGVALYDNGSNNVYKDVRLLGRQDTYYSSDATNSYFEECEIHGTVDFICGSGNAWFEKCKLLLEHRDDYHDVIAAPATKSGQDGYTFNNCIIDNADANHSMANNYYLARAWENSPKIAFYHTDYRIAKKGDTDTPITTGLDCGLTESSSAASQPSVGVAVSAAPESLSLQNGVLRWSEVVGAKAYAIFKGNDIIDIVGADVLDYVVDAEASSRSNAKRRMPIVSEQKYSVAAIGEDGLLGEMGVYREIATPGYTFFYDFRDSKFDFDDYELLTKIGESSRYVYENHIYGREFNKDRGFSVQVAGNAKIYVTRCGEGGSGEFTVTSNNGGTITPSVFDAKAPSDGATIVVEYVGSVATLSFVADAQCYVHCVKVVNEGAVGIRVADSKDKVTIRNNVAGAMVYYTIDGTEPSETNYKDVISATSAVVAAKDCWVKAISVKNGEVLGSDEKFCRTTFAGFSWDFTSIGTLLGDETSTFETGVVIDDAGEVLLVPVGENSSSIDIKTAYHDPQHGYLGIYATIPVEGPVTVTVGKCQYGNGTITLSTSEGEKWVKNPSGGDKCYHQGKADYIVTFEYTGGPTVLTLASEAGKDVYIPYLSVRDANATKVKFVNVYEKNLHGIVPEETEVNEAHQVYIPKNTTLYRSGWAVTGWEDSETGTKYDLDRKYTFYKNTTLYPVITRSTKAITDTDHELTVTWKFDQADGAPKFTLHNSENDPTSMTYVQSVNVEGSMLDVPLVLDAMLNKIDNNDERVNKLSGNGGQFNDNTAMKIPAVYGMKITLNASDKNDTEYNTSTYFEGTDHAVVKLREDGGVVLENAGTVTNNGKSITFTYEGNSSTIDVLIQLAGSGSNPAVNSNWGFYESLSVTYPVLPNVVIENVISNAPLFTDKEENPEKAGSATFTVESSATSNVNTGKRLRQGDVVTFSATADYGYTFTGFRVQGESDFLTNNEYTVPDETGIKTIEAVFARKDLIKVTATSADVTKGDVSLSPKHENFYHELPNGVEAYFESGTDVSVVSEPAKDYVIDKWMVDEDTEISGRNVYTIDNILSAESIVAYFKEGYVGTVEFKIDDYVYRETVVEDGHNVENEYTVHLNPDPNMFNNAVSIAPDKQENVKSFYIPNNYTFFMNGFTLTHWEAGGRRYELGKYYSFDEPGQPITLRPVFQKNIADKENRTRGDALYWDFRTMNLVQEIDKDDPNMNFFWTSKVSVEVIEEGQRRDHTRDVALWVHTNSEGFVRNNDMPEWVAFGPGTVFDIPSCAGATLKMYTYSPITSTTFDGHIPELDEDATAELHANGERGYVYSYVTSNPNPRVSIAIGDDNSYYKWIRCYSLPASLLELHVDMNENQGEVEEIRGAGAVDYQELADGGVAFQKGDRVTLTFKRKFGFELDKIVDVDRIKDGAVLPVIEIVRENGVITGVKMAKSTGDDIENAVKQTDGSWKGTAFVFKEIPGTGGDLESYEVQFEISTHRNIEVIFKEKPTYYVTYNTGSNAIGIAPEAVWLEVGDEFTIPKNRTLFYGDHTLKYWEDAAGHRYDFGGNYSADSDLRLYPHFVENTFTVLQITEDTKVTWDFTRGNVDTPSINYERSSGILVAQLMKGLDFIDLKIDLNASDKVVSGNQVAGKFNNNGYLDRCQINENSSITFPAIRECVIELEAISDIPKDVKISGTAHEPAKKISYTHVAGSELHSVEFGADGNNSSIYQTWCTALSITYKPISDEFMLASVTVGGTPLSDSELATLNSSKSINVSFDVVDNEEFPNVAAVPINGVTSVAQADISTQKAYITHMSKGGTIIDTYTINFIPVVHEYPELVGSPSIYVNTTGYNQNQPPLNQPGNGTISIKFNRTMKAVESSANIRLSSENVSDDQVLTARQGSTLTFRYWNLDADKEYTLTIPAGTLKDVYGDAAYNRYNSAITVTFRTASGIYDVEHRKFNWIVGVDGTLSEGINAANNATGLARFYIFVPDGEYELEGNENITVSTNEDATTLYDDEGRYREDLLGSTSFDNNKTKISRPNVSLIGQSETGTQIYNKPVIEGLEYTATIHLTNNATDFYAQDLTLENRFNYRKSMGNAQNNAARAVALQGHGSCMIMKNVSLWSYQDTYYSSREDDPDFSSYFENCTIAGVVDWVCGGGNIWFEKCNIIHRDRSGNNFVAPHTNANQQWGMVFNKCLIKPEVDESELLYMSAKDWTLARPWGTYPAQSPACTFLNDTITLLPRDAGWGVMYGGMVLRFHEYRTMNATGNLVSLGSRSLAACAPAAGSDDCILSAAEADQYTINNVLEFNPTTYTEQRAAVENLTIEDGVLSWNPSADGKDLCYFIFKKDAEGKWKYYANVAEPQLDFNTFGMEIREGIYMVRAANQRGGLGAFSDTIVYKEAERFDLTIVEVVQNTGKGWSTICLPNNAKVPEGEIKVYAAVSINDNIITLKKVDYITANKGYVVYGAVGIYTFRGSSHNALETSGFNYKHDSYLSGNPSEVKVSASTTNCYTLAYKANVSGIGFYKYTGTWLNPYKAYLDVDVFKQFNGSNSDEDDLLGKSFSKGIRFVFAPEEETTDLPFLDLNATITYETDAIYDLSGRRVIIPVPGRIYIINGAQTLWE